MRLPRESDLYVLHRYMPKVLWDGICVLEEKRRTKNLLRHLPEFCQKNQISQLTDFVYSRHKKSDTLFVLGSGASINKLDSNAWKIISANDSIGLNFWALHDFVPTYYAFEGSVHPDDVRGALLYKTLQTRAEGYSDTPVFLNCKNHIKQKAMLVDYPKLLKKNTYAYLPFAPFILSGGVMRRWLAGLAKSWRSPAWALHIANFRGSICNAINWGYIFGYKKIVLLGVDLNNTKYFWEEDPKKYPETPTNSRPDGIHRGIDPHVFPSMTIDRFLAIFNESQLAPNGISLLNGNPESALANTLPLFHFTVQDSAAGDSPR